MALDSSCHSLVMGKVLLDQLSTEWLNARVLSFR